MTAPQPPESTTERATVEESLSVRCEACGGTGRVYEGERCKFCHGTGKQRLQVAPTETLADRLESAKDCPYCDNAGWYPVPHPKTGEPEQVQCPCSCESDSLFTVRCEAAARLRELEEERLMQPWDLVEGLKKDREAAVSQWRKAERENAALRHDIERHVAIASEQAGEIEKLREALRRVVVYFDMLKPTFKGERELADVCRAALTPQEGQHGK